MKSRPLIGVLALQGAVQPHKPHIEAAGGEFRAIKTPDDFDGADAFILPGGESTTMLKLIDTFNLWDNLTENFKTKPVWGICAGAILMAEHVTNPVQKSFKLLPFSVERNGYGRQAESRHAMIENYPVSLIRAPLMKNIGPDVEVLGREDGTPVWIARGKYMATNFHPELTLDFPSPMHRAFMDRIKS